MEILIKIAAAAQAILVRLTIPCIIRETTAEEDQCDDEFKCMVIESDLHSNMFIGQDDRVTQIGKLRAEIYDRAQPEITRVYTLGHTVHYYGGRDESDTYEYTEITASQYPWVIAHRAVQYIVGEQMSRLLYKEFPEANPEA